MFKVFGEVDRDKSGNIRSEYPSWYFDPQKDELVSTIREMIRALEDDAIPHQAKAKFREGLRQKKDRLEAIEKSVPKLKDEEKNKIVKVRDEIAIELKDAHPKRSERERDLVDAHEEARRMKEPVMKLKSTEQAEFAKECNIKISPDGKISRDDMDKMYKISSKILGESTDVEYLRKP